jgi:hypothetical protein
VAPDALHRLLTTFGGVSAGQIWADYYLWELVLNAHPELKGIAEIGTWQGGFSRYLAFQAQMRRMHFRTWDVVAPEVAAPHFLRLDVFADPDPVRGFMEWAAPVVLLCDGGNKPREMALFAPHLSTDSLLIVHDWLTEVQPEEVPPMLHPVYEDVCDALGSMSRVFKVA